MAMNSTSSTVFHNAVIVTMDSQLRVFKNGGLVIEGDTIIAIGQSSEIVDQFSSAALQIVDLHGHFLLPGFINTHVHTSQQLGRGIADDVDLMTWLHRRIWPYESNMTEEDSYISTLLCGIELIHSGVTCFAEAGGQHVSGMARAVELLGLRACLTKSTMDSGEGLPVSWSNCTTEQCIEIQKELYREHHGTAEGRIRIWLGIRQIMNATDRLLIDTRDTAEALGTGIHMHVAEISYENEVVKRTREIDNGTVTYLEKINFLKSNLLSAHTVWVNDDEIGFLSKFGVKVSHCPASAMRMLGFAPIRKMFHAGVCVSLGTDGAPSNNRMSIVDEMYLASLINKGREVFANGATDPTALPAEDVLKMATINGAKSVLWDNEIGSLEVGKKVELRKVGISQGLSSASLEPGVSSATTSLSFETRADLVIVDPFSWTMTPIHDCISSLVYCMRTENIVSVICNGRYIMKDRKLVNVNEGEVISLAKQASEKLLAKAGIIIPERMYMV